MVFNLLSWLTRRGLSEQRGFWPHRERQVRLSVVSLSKTDRQTDKQTEPKRGDVVPKDPRDED